jgi:hypothetical protein
VDAWMNTGTTNTRVAEVVYRPSDF